MNEKGFFAKHAWHGLSARRRRVDVGEKEKMLAIDNFDGLLELVQAGVVEIHPWGSTLAHLEQPDRLIFDLDPGEDVPWSAVIEAALDVRAKLEEFGLQSFVKTSGGKGLHVVLPIEASDRLGRREEIHPVGCRSDGQGAARPLRRHHVEERAARTHLYRLCQERPGRHRGRAPTRPARCRRHRCRRRSPGTSSPSRSAPIISASTICARGWMC